MPMLWACGVRLVVDTIRNQHGAALTTSAMQAQAQAFASAWAKANSGCKCKVSLEATATAVEAIYASATADVFLSVCSEGAASAYMRRTPSVTGARESHTPFGWMARLLSAHVQGRCTDAVHYAGEGMAGVSAVAKAYEDQTVEAVALALADAVVDGEDCGAAVAACADVRDNYACCDIIVDNTASTFSQDAIAEVSAHPGRILVMAPCSARTRSR